jgi:hypothetical protein
MNEDLINRIIYYLSSGGLFNPELADHLAVRNLLMECREALAQPTWVNATTWRGLTDEERSKIWGELPSTKNEERDACIFAECIELYLKEKNT